MVQEMLDHGADPNKISPEGITPFQKAMAVLDPEEGDMLDVADREWRVIKLFLEYPGIDLNVPYDKEKTVAEFMHHVSITRPREIDDDILEYLAQHQAKQEHNELKQHTAPALSQRRQARF
jgi:hypothetical protein